jgi:hypothetical protein
VGEYTPIISSSDAPLHNGDKVQVFPSVPAGAYCYVFWIKPDGEVVQAFAGRSGDLPAVGEWKLPAGPKTGLRATWYEVEEEGHHTVIVGQTQEPLSEDDLQAFRAQDFLELEAALPKSPLVEFEFPWRGRTSVRRGAGLNVVVSPKEDLKSLADYLQRFDAYHGWRFECTGATE